MGQLPLRSGSSLSATWRKLSDRVRLSPISIQAEMFSSTAIKMRILSIQTEQDSLALSG